MMARAETEYFTNERYTIMKHIIKAVLLIGMFIALVGSIGAYDNNTMSALGCIAVCGVCTLGTYIIMKGWNK